MTLGEPVFIVDVKFEYYYICVYRNCNVNRGGGGINSEQLDWNKIKTTWNENFCLQNLHRSDVLQLPQGALQWSTAIFVQYDLLILITRYTIVNFDIGYIVILINMIILPANLSQLERSCSETSEEIVLFTYVSNTNRSQSHDFPLVLLQCSRWYFAVCSSSVVLP